MGILDSLKTVAANGLKKAATATTKAVADSSTKAMESVIAKTTALVGSKVTDAVLKDLGGAPSPNTASSPNTAAPPNPAASAKAAALVGSKAAPNEQSDARAKDLSPAEVEVIIDAKVRAKGIQSNWRYSIVDLMTALDMNSSLDSRKALAARLNYYGYDADGSAEKNTWLHAELLKAIAKNGGEVPSHLL